MTHFNAPCIYLHVEEKVMKITEHASASLFDSSPIPVPHPRAEDSSMASSFDANCTFYVG